MSSEIKIHNYEHKNLHMTGYNSLILIFSKGKDGCDPLGFIDIDLSVKF